MHIRWHIRVRVYEDSLVDTLWPPSHFFIETHRGGTAPHSCQRGSAQTSRLSCENGVLLQLDLL